MQLSPERITDAALAILAEYGLGDVSMRRVAAALGVAPGALYWHIANKQELIASMARAIVQPLFDGSVPDPAVLSARLREVALGVRDGAEVLVAAVGQPGSPVREALSHRFEEAVEAFAAHAADGQVAGDHIRAVALGLLHLTIGEAAVHQSSAQLAELTGLPGGADDADAAAAQQAHARAVEYLLDGMVVRAATD